MSVCATVLYVVRCVRPFMLAVIIPFNNKNILIANKLHEDTEYGTELHKTARYLIDGVYPLYTPFTVRPSDYVAVGLQVLVLRQNRADLLLR
jgi:hypothetical protein